MEVQVFDPAMCCSTGVCGPKVDPDLARFAGDLEWLATQGVKVTRFNLSQEPGAFVSSPPVSALLHRSGKAALPVVLVGGAVHSSGRYPARTELAQWAGIAAASEQVSQPCFDEKLIPVAVAAGPAQACCGGESSGHGCC
ncbi:MAG: arsenite efflux transporter metallochaperone ArsD [Candidatus Dormibacteria bacterium]